LEREISIRRDMLPEVVTRKHVKGVIVVSFYNVEPDNKEYEKNVKDEASIRTRRKVKKGLSVAEINAAIEKANAKAGKKAEK